MWGGGGEVCGGTTDVLMIFLQPSLSDAYYPSGLLSKCGKEIKDNNNNSNNNNNNTNTNNNNNNERISRAPFHVKHAQLG